MADQFWANHLPASPFQRLSRPFLRFFEIEAAGGILLLFCTVVALVAANSPWAAAYLGFWETPVTLSFGSLRISHTLSHWINDGLMTIFFFLVGLEIKRELISGELRDRRAASLPVMAAIGGMIVPAIVYKWVLGNHSAVQGWAIPMATDIAFVVGFLALLGTRVPHGLKIFLLSLAIVDDIGAVGVIALFYSGTISLSALAAGIAGFALIVLLNRMGVRQVSAYVVVGVLIWAAFLASGIHPTVAGVLLGLLTPASAWIGHASLADIIASWQSQRNAEPERPVYDSLGINGLIGVARETVSPLERLELALHPWVAFFIMPVFALANAGIPIVAESVQSPVTRAVALGLVLGKVTGIVLFSWLAVKLLKSRLPARTGWLAITGAGLLGGIGFTMSIFIAGLALDGSTLVAGKTGTLIGSAVSAMFGLAVLYLALPRTAKAGATAPAQQQSQGYL